MFKGVPGCSLTGTKVTLDAIIKVNYIVDSNNTVYTIFAVYIVYTVFTVYFTSMLCRVTLIVAAMRWRI